MHICECIILWHESKFTCLFDNVWPLSDLPSDLQPSHRLELLSLACRYPPVSPDAGSTATPDKCKLFDWPVVYVVPCALHFSQTNLRPGYLCCRRILNLSQIKEMSSAYNIINLHKNYILCIKCHFESHRWNVCHLKARLQWRGLLQQYYTSIHTMLHHPTEMNKIKYLTIIKFKPHINNQHLMTRSESSADCRHHEQVLWGYGDVIAQL